MFESRRPARRFFGGGAVDGLGIAKINKSGMETASVSPGVGKKSYFAVEFAI
jgi:hypothetical protein